MNVHLYATYFWHYFGFWYAVDRRNVFHIYLLLIVIVPCSLKMSTSQILFFILFFYFFLSAFSAVSHRL